MNPTPLNPRPFAALRFLALLVGALWLFTGGRLLAADNPMPLPPELEPDVQFWIRVYTQIDSNSGFLHDQYNLRVVYDTLHFPSDSSPAERQRQVDAARDRLSAALRRIADAGPAPLSPEDQRIHDLWGDGATAARLREAVDDIRFQLGQSDRFREGLIRSGAWETHIEEVLANLGLPPELAVLPHVESSFNPFARSKVGAAGLWQFMRSTGRRYMRIDGSVDDRLDPFRSTEAAAQLLAYNYRVLGTWPLALTAYNHGTAGMLRAKEQLGTDDIVRIVRNYTSRTFGFASRNFYVSFLAALEIDHNPEKYFGSLQRESEAKFQVVSVPGYVPIKALEHALDIDPVRLRALNPALLRPVWEGRLRVPRAYQLRLPDGGQHWSTELLAQRLKPAELFAGQPTPPHYRVQRGDTLALLADRFGMPIQQLARLNGLRTSARLRPGRTLVLPETPPVTVAANAPSSPAPAANPPQSATSPLRMASTGARAVVAPALAGAVTPEEAQRESAEDSAAAEATEEIVTVTAMRHGAGGPQPVSAAQAEALAPGVGPAAEPQQSADPTDYGVGRDDTIRVATDETLGHYADWLSVSAARLRALNHMSFRKPVLVGHRIRLDFSKVSRESFEDRRKEYHRELQASYFAAHRIVGTEVYIARSGDSLWTLTQHTAAIPEWLLQQYNPDVDFASLHAGTQIVIPRVAEVTSGG
jgi:membrane-bound lytic murein transglycosylase D